MRPSSARPAGLIVFRVGGRCCRCAGGSVPPRIAALQSSAAPGRTGRLLLLLPCCRKPPAAGAAGDRAGRRWKQRRGGSRSCSLASRRLLASVVRSHQSPGAAPPQALPQMLAANTRSIDTLTAVPGCGAQCAKDGRCAAKEGGSPCRSNGHMSFLPLSGPAPLPGRFALSRQRWRRMRGQRREKSPPTAHAKEQALQRVGCRCAGWQAALAWASRKAQLR